MRKKCSTKVPQEFCILQLRVMSISGSYLSDSTMFQGSMRHLYGFKCSYFSKGAIKDPFYMFPNFCLFDKETSFIVPHRTYFDSSLFQKKESYRISSEG